MKLITKNNEPPQLVEHRAQPHSNYKNLQKDDTRASLLDEQGHICCYCMKRIPEKGKDPDSKIEHFCCQNGDNNNDLRYSNLLLACSGGQGYPKNFQSCDTYKGNKNLTFNPCGTQPNVESLIKYLPNGEISSNDENLDKEINEVLNLNTKRLVEARRAVYESVRDHISNEQSKLGKRKIPLRKLEDEKKRWLTKKEYKYPEFCMVGVYVINKKISRIKR